MLKIGDRVSRNIMLSKPERKYGEVVEIYKSKQGMGYSPTRLYAVKWDGEKEIQRGYFEEGLQKE
jgi:hypothetical protein